jgi:hypothetical protein
MPNGLRLMLLFWQLGLVDTLTMFYFCLNAGSQFGSIVVMASVGKCSDISSTGFLEPFSGLLTSYMYIQSAKNAAQKTRRIASIAILISAYLSCALTGDRATNGTLGGTISAQIALMRAILAIGGSNTNALSEYLLMPSVKPFAIMPNPIPVRPKLFSKRNFTKIAK